MRDATTLDLTRLEQITAWLVDWLSGELGLVHSEIDPAQSFLSYGMDSVQAMTMVGDLETHLGLRLPPTLAWDYPHINALSEHLADRIEAAPADRPAAASSPAPAAEVEGLLAELDMLSDQDVDSLLARYLDAAN